MRHSVTFLLALQSLALANLGDWKIWTNTKSAHNAVVRGQTVLIATGGGVVEWSASRTKQKLYTTLDGLPEINTVSVLADESGAVWAVGGSGRLAKLGPGASTWESTGSYAASAWSFNPAATTYWKGFLILGGSKGLSLFSTTAKVAMDNISSIQGKTVDFSSALVVNDTLWVGTSKGTAYCAPDQAGWEKAGTPGHYLTDPARWHWVNDIPGQIMLRGVGAAIIVNPGLWADGMRNIAADGKKFVWKDGQASIPGAIHAVEAPGQGFVVSSSLVGPVFVNPDGSWKPMEVEGSFPFNPLPISVSIDANGGLYALGQSVLNVSAIAKRPVGTYSWTLDTIQFKAPDSTGKQVTIFPWWDPGETSGRKRIGFDVEQDGRIAIATWANGVAPEMTGAFLSRQPNKWSRIHHKTDTCLHELLYNGNSIGTGLHAIRAREDGLWISELISSGIGNFPLRIHHLPKGSDGPLSCLDLPFVTSEYQTFDLLPLGQDLWLATKDGIKRFANFRRSFTGPALSSPTSPVGAGSTEFFRLERYTLAGKDWILAAGTTALGLIDPATDTFHAVVTGADQTYRALAVDSKKQIWGAGNEGIDIFQVSLEQDTNGTVAPVFEKVRRITRVDGLPENEILDLRLDSASGRALLTTEHAVVLWASPFRPVTKKLDPAKVKVWPNPVRLSQNRTLFVDGVTEQAEFHLLAQDGTLVYHLPSGRQTTGMFQLELPPTKNLRPGLYFWAVKDGNTVARGPLLIGY